MSPFVLATASVLFTNYYVLFSYIYYLQFVFLENNVFIDGAQRKNTVYKFQLKSFENNRMTLFQVFLRKSEKLLIGRVS